LPSGGQAVNADAEFKKRYKLGAVNSINWARIAAQVVYYVYAALRAGVTQDRAVAFAVPTGNFGNALAAHVASEMGVPLTVIVCTNENDVLDEFFRTGIYRVRKSDEVAVTSSPSMDIASASNFERWVYDFRDQRADRVNMLWSALKKKGQFNVHDTEPGALMAIDSDMATQAEVLKTIKLAYQQWGIIIDPHTAVAMTVALRRPNDGRIIVLETAQPAKFADTIREAIDIEVPVPKGYEHLADLDEHTTRINPDPEAVKRFIAAHVV
jgi:threonine synthase